MRYSRSQLSTFVIPDTILGIARLTKAVYIGGKLVRSTNMADVNAAITDLRAPENKFRRGHRNEGRHGGRP